MTHARRLPGRRDCARSDEKHVCDSRRKHALQSNGKQTRQKGEGLFSPCSRYKDLPLKYWKIAFVFKFYATDFCKFCEYLARKFLMELVSGSAPSTSVLDPLHGRRCSRENLDSKQMWPSLL